MNIESNLTHKTYVAQDAYSPKADGECFLPGSISIPSLLLTLHLSPTTTLITAKVQV